MRKAASLFLVFIFLITLSGCSGTAGIGASHKKEGYSKKITKASIFITVAQENRKAFNDQFSTDIVNEFKEKGVESVVYLRTQPLTQETINDINRKCSDYAPSHFILIKQSVILRTTNTIGNPYSGGSFEISIIDGEDQKAVWKGILNVSFNLDIRGNGSKAARKLIDRLLKEGML